MKILLFVKLVTTKNLNNQSFVTLQLLFKLSCTKSFEKLDKTYVFAKTCNFMITFLVIFMNLNTFFLKCFFVNWFKDNYPFSPPPPKKQFSGLCF